MGFSFLCHDTRSILGKTTSTLCKCHSLLQIQMEVDIIFGDGNAAAENLFAKHGRKSKFFINVCDKSG